MHSGCINELYVTSNSNSHQIFLNLFPKERQITWVRDVRVFCPVFWARTNFRFLLTFFDTFFFSKLNLAVLCKDHRFRFKTSDEITLLNKQLAYRPFIHIFKSLVWGYAMPATIDINSTFIEYFVYIRNFRKKYTNWLAVKFDTLT